MTILLATVYELDSNLSASVFLVFGIKYSSFCYLHFPKPKSICKKLQMLIICSSSVIYLNIFLFTIDSLFNIYVWRLYQTVVISVLNFSSYAGLRSLQVEMCTCVHFKIASMWCKAFVVFTLPLCAIWKSRLKMQLRLAAHWIFVTFKKMKNQVINRNKICTPKRIHAKHTNFCDWFQFFVYFFEFQWYLVRNQVWRVLFFYRNCLAFNVERKTIAVSTRLHRGHQATLETIP